MNSSTPPASTGITPFKEGINPTTVAYLAARITQVAGSFQVVFNAQEFTRDACRGLSDLALKARVDQVIDALHRHLPVDDPATAMRLACAAAEAWREQQGDRSDALGEFAAWPLVDFVGTHGRSCPAEALAALREMTVLFTAEFAIRPLLVDDLPGTLTVLTGWLTDPRPEVRRLVSEGTRPRLPWGVRLTALVDDPSPTLPLLQQLKDDPSEDVRRSVANHLNDMAKDHPQVVLDTCRKWQQGVPQNDPDQPLQKLIKHALRTLIKAGDPSALGLIGVDPDTPVTAVDFALSPTQIELGEAVCWSAELHNPTPTRQMLVVDYAVFHLKQNGSHTAKVFKGMALTLAPGERRTISKRHPLKAITTRRYYAGAHQIELRVNGQPSGRADFTLTLP